MKLDVSRGYTRSKRSAAHQKMMAAFKVTEGRGQRVSLNARRNFGSRSPLTIKTTGSKADP